MKEKIKSIVREKLSAKKIVLFGAGKVAEEFYQNFKNDLNITHCVSNIKKEWGEKKFQDTLDICKYRRQDIGEDEYMVVCGPFAFRSIEFQLKADGFVMYENFILSDLAAAIFQNKKIALFYGQCVLRDIYQCITQVEGFNNEYASIFTLTAPKQTITLNRVVYYAKDVCDLYVYTPKFLDRDSVYFLQKEQLPVDCRIISVSNVMISLYWPQINEKRNAINPMYLHSYNVKRNMVFYHSMFRREDCNINRMVMEGKSTEEIVKRLSADDFYTEKQVLRNTKIALKSLAMAERGIDIGIKEYILENYQKEMLYQNFVHTNKNIIWEYVYRLLKKIDVSIDQVEQLRNDSPLYIHHGGDVPIYPCVAKHLKLEFINENTEYEIMVEDGIEKMSFCEYTAYYAEYTRKTMEIMNMW